VPLPTLLEGLIAASAAPPSVLRGLSSQSASLLLVAASDLVSHALAGGATSAAEQLALTHGLLGQVVVVLEQSARNGSYDEATRHTLRLATLLRRLPRELQPTAVGIVGYIVGYSPSPRIFATKFVSTSDCGRKIRNKEECKHQRPKASLNLLKKPCS
jgi:hypothetical protein